MVKLVRCRNPWGNEVEWNGAWSDRDPAWNSIPIQDRQNLGQYSKADGEFWVSFRNLLLLDLSITTNNKSFKKMLVFLLLKDDI